MCHFLINAAHPLPCPALPCLNNSVKITPYFNYRWKDFSPKVGNEDTYYRHSITSWLIHGPNQGREPTTGDVQEYVTNLSACITTAIDLGFKRLFVNAMIDPAYDYDGAATWRWVVDLSGGRCACL
jgi:hypothetical protein